MKRFLFNFGIFCLSLIIFALLLNPQKYISTCFDGIKLWALTILPALLPFYFLTLLLSKLNVANKFLSRFKRFSSFFYNSNGYGAFIQFMSIISGYPVGAKLISEFYKEKKINKEEATKFSTFCSTSGPMFVIGSVGAIMLKSKIVGLIMFSSHIISSFLNGIIFRKYCDNRLIAQLLDKKNDNNILYDCAYNAVISSLITGTFVAVFFVLSQIINNYKILFPINYILSFIFGDIKKATGFTSGLIECASGCNILSQTSGILKIPLCTALISFGGISVIIQSVAFLKEAKVKIKIFILSKILMMITSFLISLIFCAIFEIS